MPGNCSTSWVHRDQPGDAESGSVRSTTSGDSRAVIKEGKQAVKMTPSLLPSVPLEPSAAGAEPAGLQSGEFVAAAGVPRRIENWSLTSLQQRLVKTGGRLVKHARY